MNACLFIVVLITATTALFAAERFAWDWHKVESPRETLSQVPLSEGERIALTAALSAEFNTPISNLFSAADEGADIGIKLLDLNGDHTPEIIAQARGEFWCGATGNCPLLVFRKSGKIYESMLPTGEYYEYQGFTVMQQRSGGYRNLIFNQHESSTRQAVLVYKYRDGKYRPADCYEASWAVIGDEDAIAKEPRMTPCRELH